jgi:lipopolysaccharide export LptBFGC system permease protein LptF
MQLTGSIALAMMIPAAMLLASVFFLHVLNEDEEAKR